ncbi:TetR/AcrR family transcriptional regulator [Phytohabitans sp. ZYX-F-186]|uniref:TetR/AcrR family transcriptional regulator n=1 Tax=Phytohabitans maris TaxID=3071409 RepID=A0ABU0ZIU4_9ACTN|nr:TetR/AcrR family transcriptional regulator [Phytohabitans sp. ZYX-F-186]MDQ7906324.1 TetR/AcrR family transcriptional regulator [Phytohabitans sp. ZYX-F-186]
MVDTQDTASRARTRQAIIDAAIAVLGKNLSAPLSEVATAADVGRTTLHRYYPERSDLLSAVRAESVLRLERATEHARLDEGTGAEALHRLCEEYFELGDVLSLVFGDPHCLEEVDRGQSGAEDRFKAVVERGHRDGSIDPELPATWLESVLWSQLYAAWSYVTDSGESRHHVLRLMLRTLAGAVSPPP